MDLIKVLGILSKEFESHDIHYAVIGGFAMNALGLVRSTLDLDLLMLAEDTPKLNKLLESIGYTCVYKTENVSQYTSPSDDLGEIDVIHAFRESSLKMLKRSKQKSLFNEEITLNVLIPEDLIGLKVQALMNDEGRKLRELADIQMIMDSFTENEKEEFRKAAGSSELKEEFRHMARNRAEFRKNDGTVDLDRVVRFISDMNALLNYPRKPFIRMTGNNFRL